MMRSTEYGAIAILSASGYGNPKTLQNSSIKTTTGNKTGVYFIVGDFEELVAGGLENYIFKGINTRYYDTYTGSQSSARKGDALGTASTTNPGCSKWHSNNVMYSWIVDDTSHSYVYFSRGYRGFFHFLILLMAMKNIVVELQYVVQDFKVIL